MKKSASTQPASDRSLATTVQAACEHHVNAVASPGSQATYRSLLRPLLDRHGELSPADALARLADIETEFTALIGVTRAHKAVMHVIAALRNAGHALLTLQQASRKHRIADSSLRTLVHDQRIRCRYRHRGGRETILFDPDELVADLAALPKCRAPGCQAPGMGRSGCCGEHFSYGGRDRARAREDETLDDPDRDWYTAEEAAKRLGTWWAAIVAMVKRGELPGERVGRHWRIPKQAVEQLRKARRGRPRQTMPTAEQTAARRQEVRRLVEQGNLSAPQIARQVDVDKTTLYRDLRVLNLDPPGDRKPSRRLSAEEVARLPGLYAAGHTYAELSQQFDVSPGHIRDHLERDVPRRPAGTRPKHPPPTERPCALCGKLFTPKRAEGERRYHSADCANDALRDAISRALTDKDLLSIGELASDWEITDADIGYYIREGHLPAELITVPEWNRSVWGVRPEDWNRFHHPWASGTDGRRRSRWQNLDTELGRRKRLGEVARLAAAAGKSEAWAEGIIRARLERRRERLAHRAAGRPRGSALLDRNLRWQARAEELRSELFDGETGPTDHTVWLLVALEDWFAHPEDWPRDKWPADPNDPEGFAKSHYQLARDRVRKAVKRLQNERTEITLP